MLHSRGSNNFESETRILFVDHLLLKKIEQTNLFQINPSNICSVCQQWSIINKKEIRLACTYLLYENLFRFCYHFLNLSLKRGFYLNKNPGRELPFLAESSRSVKINSNAMAPYCNILASFYEYCQELRPGRMNK